MPVNANDVAMQAGPPDVAAYDPYSYRIHADPYPTYAWMREHAPLYRNEERDFWALSRYGDVSAALRDPDLFSSRNGISLEPDLWGPQAVETSFLLAMDAPDHALLRRLARAVLMPRWVEALEPRVRELTRSLLAEVLERPVFDFAADFAAVLPSEVMGELIGIPAADRAWIRADNEVLNHCEDGSEHRPAEANAAGLRLAVYYAQLISERRRRPADDLTSRAIAARVDGRPLNDSQLVAFLFLMVSVTNESTGKMIGLAWHYGAAWPDVQRAGLNGRAADWAGESLRYDSPTQMVGRTLTRATGFHGTTVPAGARIALLPASANRDPAAFADPDAFDLDRDRGGMLSFGRGPHFCLGAALAQQEITIALAEIGAHVSSYEVDLDSARRVHSAQQRGFTSLPCTVRLRPNRPSL
jgi:cytochrome P450